MGNHRETRKGLGESTWEITEYLPEQRISYKSTFSRFPYNGAYTFEALGSATKFTSCQVDLELPFVLRLVSPVAKHRARAQLVVNLHRLKDMLEML